MAEYQSFNQKNTRLVIVEGYTEKLIVNYLYNRYQRSVIYVKAEDAHGGNPHEIILFAINFNKHRDYQKRYIFIDADKKIKQEDLELAKKNGFEFIYNNKCGESTILQIVKPNKDWTKSTSQCKHFFKKIIGSTENICNYLNKTPDSTLKNNPTFNQLINIIQKF